MSLSPIRSCQRPGGDRGFALLITLTLLAFLLLLLVGLATYTRIETAVAGNSQRQMQAREHALLALNVAFARLQQYAGPDQRVTATGENFGGSDGTRRYTGVWDSTSNGTRPLAWLVSGNETNPLAVTPGDTIANPRELVGVRTSGQARDVVVPAVDIGAAGVPGQPANAVIGRYAWWVGDQGVKAPVAAPDRTRDIAYPPFESAEPRSRIGQQISLGAGATDESGDPVFEPHDANNAALVRDNKISAVAQLAFLRDNANSPIGLVAVRRNFHSWSPDNLAVLANTKLGGLRQDLSLKPDLLGAAFAAWANYAAYMEDPLAPESPAPEPAYDAARPVRRRYRLEPALVSDGGVFSVAPVLTHLILNFDIRAAASSSTALRVRLRPIVGLWNPYASGLVPEDLRLELEGLPVVTVTDSNGGSTTVSLSDVFGAPCRISLPWDATAVQADKRTWLPGRVYYWSYVSNTSDPGPAGNRGLFYDRGISHAGQGFQRSLGNYTGPAGSNVVLTVSAPRTTIHATLFRARDASSARPLARYTSPEFDHFSVPSNAPSNADDFGFVFRLRESFDTPADPGSWLRLENGDPRHPALPSASFRAVPQGTDPAQYVTSQSGALATSNPGRFFDRVFPVSSTNGLSYNEDVPVFELPRSPLLSLGALQHFQLEGARPLAFGNSWAAEVALNGVNTAAAFDRFYFSGLSPNDAGASVPTPLPNPAIHALARNRSGQPLGLHDLLAAPAAQSSRYLLARNAFNVNATDAAAWAAVIRGIRFSGPGSFQYLDCNPVSGTAADNSITSLNAGSAHFLRFSHAAQETFEADTFYVQSGSGGSTGVPETTINTHLFRRGLRALGGAEVTALANAIRAGVTQRQNTAGPFRSLEEFLRSEAPGGQSVIESAIADAGLNESIVEFSSQWLTQADIMTALAPVLFARSDTFLIRAYGEAVNPTTGATEGRAWCEATVQRVPEYFDKAQPAETPPAALNELNRLHGRRFKVVSFRWLTRSDI